MALNWKNDGINGVEPGKVALTAVNRTKLMLTALNWKRSGVTGVEPEKYRRYRRWTGKIVALTALNRKISHVSGVELERQRR